MGNDLHKLALAVCIPVAASISHRVCRCRCLYHRLHHHRLHEPVYRPMEWWRPAVANTRFDSAQKRCEVWKRISKIFTIWFAISKSVRKWERERERKNCQCHKSTPMLVVHCVLCAGSQSFSTTKGTLLPEEQQIRSSALTEKFELIVDHSVQEMDIELVRFASVNTSAVPIGHTTIPFDMLSDGEDIDQWFELQNDVGQLCCEVLVSLEISAGNHHHHHAHTRRDSLKQNESTDNDQSPVRVNNCIYQLCLYVFSDICLFYFFSCAFILCWYLIIDYYCYLLWFILWSYCDCVMLICIVFVLYCCVFC